jgi:glycosyl transferase family 25
MTRFPLEPITVLTGLLFISTTVLVFAFAFKVYSTKDMIQGFTTESDTSLSLQTVKKYIINLDKRTDRMAVTIPKLAQYGFTGVTRWPAVNGRSLTLDDIRKIVKPEAMQPIIDNKRKQHHELSIGAVGCALSHLQVWKNLLDKNKDESALLIFEDDTNPSLKIDDVSNIMYQLPNDWDIFLIGTIDSHIDPSKKPSIEKVGGFYGLHAYMINKKCVEMLLSESLPMDMQIDSWLSVLSLQDRLKIYKVANGNWHQNTEVNSTDIQTFISM